MNNYNDYDFAPSSSSHLASLFGSSSISLDNSSLTYTAPKQPKFAEAVETKSEPQQKAESSVICARVVQVWKLVDNKYIPMGKHGLAIIGSSTQNTYEIILYREKRNVIVRIKISQNFEISSKKDGFASFYDSLKENWLIKFANSDDCTTVLNQIETFGGKTVALDEKNEDAQQTTKPSDIVNNSENPQNKAKADILSRIAKMGQSILPNKNTDVDDSGSEENFKAVDDIPSNENRLESQPVVPTSIATNVMQVPRHFQNIPNTVVIGQPMAYDPLNLYVAESRAQNSEIRINLSQISDKVNQILKLVDNEKPVDNNGDILKSKIKVLDLRNDNLSKELRIYQEENARLKLQMSQQEDMLRNLEESKTETNLLKEQEAVKIDDFKREINTYKDSIERLNETIEKQRVEVEELRSQLEKCEDNSDLKNEISDLQQKLKDFEENQSSENASKPPEQENKEKIGNLTAQLKVSMNEMYGKIITNFTEGKKYETSEINSIIARNIKFTTLKIIHNIQDVYKDEPETS